MIDGRVFKITYLSVLSTTTRQLSESCRKVEEELGVRIEFIGFEKEDCEENGEVFAELCRNTLHSDFVHIRCMGDPWIDILII